jgi:signal transduction histidine kinase
VIVAEVRDQGGGIPQDLHDKVFELYFTTKKEGSGIGLAQTYQILEWHYGSVGFESVAGTGTTFRFHLPAAGPVVEAGPEYVANAATSPRAS